MPTPPQKPDSGPPAPIRIVGQALTGAVARYPRFWPLLKAPTRRFFERNATSWDERISTWYYKRYHGPAFVAEVNTQEAREPAGKAGSCEIGATGFEPATARPPAGELGVSMRPLPSPPSPSSPPEHDLDTLDVSVGTTAVLRLSSKDEGRAHFVSW